jgi:hypothetical protein
MCSKFRRNNGFTEKLYTSSCRYNLLRVSGAYHGCDLGELTFGGPISAEVPTTSSNDCTMADEIREFACFAKEMENAIAISTADHRSSLLTFAASPPLPETAPLQGQLK